MQVKLGEQPALPESAATRIQNDITAALNAISPTKDGKLVVNPTVWYRQSTKTAQPRPCVMNSAHFFSRAFQEALVERGWCKEKALGKGPDGKGVGQRIDAYIELPVEGPRFAISRENFLALLERVWTTEEAKHGAPPFLEGYYGYYRRSLFPLPTWAAGCGDLFKPVESQEPRALRVGVEFETGNIASSFRALAKLNVLYWLDHIDVGVFVTSESKETAAARIWPSSNRNGSFAELRARQYRRIVQLPLWEFGFWPEDYDSTAMHFWHYGHQYAPQKTDNEQVEHQGVVFDVYIREVVEKSGTKKHRVLLPRAAEKALDIFGEESAEALPEEEEGT